jgi:hypothetical protein
MAQIEEQLKIPRCSNIVFYSDYDDIYTHSHAQSPENNCFLLPEAGGF